MYIRTRKRNDRTIKKKHRNKGKLSLITGEYVFLSKIVKDRI